ncbi:MULTISPECIES: TetR/AcrR family transcriptional regulator [Streptomyces violaceusniger group]|uniref:HTH tetR-type domain-containing protein n=2 Tax=Streptomyces rhizosphaericus TaxID=114699 RepID=A0ABP4CT09_9ACTN|nr:MULTISPECIES: TetR/AcrR family transcriptional regulator [Streptomyces violaceusniger group]
MPRTPEASAAVRDATRARIRRAAVLLMAEQGYHATTLRQVAARAGVADGLPSRYFGSKSGLLIDVADGWRERTRSALAAQQGSDPKVTLRLLVRSALLGLDTSPEEVDEGRAVSALLADPQARDVLREAGADIASADLLQALDDALVEAGSPDPDGDRLVLMAGIRGGLVLAAEDADFPLRRLEDALLDRILPQIT